MVPVTISRAKSQAGFDVSLCLVTCLLADSDFGFTTGPLWAGEAPAIQ